MTVEPIMQDVVASNSLGVFKMEYSQPSVLDAAKSRGWSWWPKWPLATLIVGTLPYFPHHRVMDIPGATVFSQISRAAVE